MFRSLKKSDTYLDIESKINYGTINSKNTEVLFDKNTFILSTSLNPIDDNQKDDVEDILIDDDITKVTFRDEKLIKKFTDYCNSKIKELEVKNLSFQLILIYKKDLFKFNTIIELNTNELKFTIKR